MLTLEEAREAVLAQVTALGAERVALPQARGRVLAEDVSSPIDHPSFDNSAMDGYAVRWSEVEGASAEAPRRLPVAFNAPAGVDPPALPPGSAARIMTGGKVPEGADTVVMREDTDEGVEGSVAILALPGAGRGAHIRRRGENLQVGARALSRGEVLDAGAIGLLAAFGRSVVAVGRRPRVAIVSTGDELVEVDQPPGPGQIVNSSSWMLQAMVEEAGGEAVVLPIARDTVESTREVFASAVGASDLVLSVGGVSMGDFDVVKAVVEELCGGELTFWRVRVKPGKPLAFGVERRTGRPILGLPGNPVSSWVGFWQFVRPVLRKMAGAHELGLPGVRATLQGGVRSTSSRLELLRGRLTVGAAGGFHFAPLENQGSGNVMSVVRVNALAHIPLGVSRMEAGEEVWSAVHGW